MKLHFTALITAVLFALGAFLETGCGKKSVGPPIYDTKADGAKLIADALAVAQREHMRVLIEFGANWCIWCHRLHDLLTADPEISAYFKHRFLLVLVDVDNRNGPRRNEELVARYSNPIEHGLPGLILLDPNGQQLKTQDPAEFETGDHYDRAKVMQFLKEWASKPEAAK